MPVRVVVIPFLNPKGFSDFRLGVFKECLSNIVHNIVHVLVVSTVVPKECLSL